MPNIKISLDQETYGRLSEAAVRELRPIPWHVLVILRRSLGMSFPTEHGGKEATSSAKAQKAGVS
jgi:hypothetical protein